MIWLPSMRKVYTISATKRGWLALISIGCIVYFFVVVLIFHALRPDVQPISKAMSNYAVGPYGFLMISAFFALALAMFTLALGLAGELMPTRLALVGALLLSIASAGLIVVGIFPGDVNVPHPPATITGLIHWIAGGTSFLSIMIAAFLFSYCFKVHESWQSFHRPALVLAITAVVASGVFGGLALIGWIGVGERIYITASLLWPLLTAVRLRSLIAGKRRLIHAYGSARTHGQVGMSNHRDNG
jgi:hypothetical membrane protein